MPPKGSNTISREVTITRLLNARIELVWEVWTDKHHVAAWWGPMGFFNPMWEWKAVPGEKIAVHMQAPDGLIVPMDGEFVEVVKPHRLVFISGKVDKKGNREIEARNTVTLSEENGKTRLDIHVIVTKLTPDAQKSLGGMKGGWNQSIDKLEHHLSSLQTMNK